MSEIQNQINQLIENREMARMGGGQKAIDKQHEKGKYTARNRMFNTPFVHSLRLFSEHSLTAFAG